MDTEIIVAFRVRVLRKTLSIVAAMQMVLVIVMIV